MRKAFSVSELSFGKETGLVKELVNYVVESLGGVYLEMEKNINQVTKTATIAIGNLTIHILDTTNY